MTCREIYEASLALISERQDEDNEDYLERAPYLFAAVCLQLEPLDRVIREAQGEAPPVYPDNIYMDLEDDLPLSAAFTPAVSYYLAAMLVLDENEEMYEEMYALYSDAVARIQSTLPCKSAPITDVYRALI